MIKYVTIIKISNISIIKSTSCLISIHVISIHVIHTNGRTVHTNDKHKSTQVTEEEFLRTSSGPCGRFLSHMNLQQDTAKAMFAQKVGGRENRILCYKTPFRTYS